MPSRWVLYLALVCSGAAALIYEVAWTRMLGLVMGHTVAAATTVLAAFMAGLAAGAALAGRIAARMTRTQALHAYAALEIVIAVCALALPLEIRWLDAPLAWAYRDGDGGTLFAVTRLMAALGVVTVPAIAMGATLPLVVRWHVTSAAAAGPSAGRLSAANTTGAAMGAAMTGFVLLPTFGIALTTWIGIALNVVAAATAVALARRPSAVTTTAVSKPVKSPRWSLPLADNRFAAAAAVAAGGAASMALQLVWTRILAIAIGPTTFAFSAMVTAFIAGIAIGSTIGSRLAKRTVSAAAVGAALLCAAAATLLSSLAAPQLPLVIADLVAAPDAAFGTVVWQQTLAIAAVMLPMTAAFGAIWPLAVAAIAREDGSVAAQVGWLSSVNSAAAVAGALVAGLWLIPWWGLEVTLRGAALLLATTAAAVTLRTVSRRAPRAVWITAASGCIAAALWLPGWDRALISSGAYKYAAYMPPEFREPMLGAGQLLYYKEGAAATISVRRLTGTTSLAIDGKIDASDAGDMLTQKVLAHAPLLLHPQARHVAIIGLGSGVTLASALTHPIERADVIEISPEVVEASAFFERDTRGALRDRRTRLLVTDGRTHLRLARTRYDVVISEPSNPWMAGIAALFTREFFTAARARLAPGGIVCQWAHTYDISDEDLRSIVATFSSVFPHQLLWQVGDGDVLLLGSDDPLEPRIATALRSWPAAPGADLASVGATSADVLFSLAGAGTSALRQYSAGAPIQTDDRLALEFTGPRAIYGRTSVNRPRLPRIDDAEPGRLRLGGGGPVRRSLGEGGASGRGVMLLKAEAYHAAFDEFARAIQENPADQGAADGLLDAGAAAGRLADAAAILERLETTSNAIAVAVSLSRLRAARGEFDRARTQLERLAGDAPSLRVFDQLASIAADAGNVTTLATHVASLERAFPGSEPTAYYMATLASRRGEWDRAIRGAEALRSRGDSPRGLNLLASLYASRGRPELARAVLHAAMAANPRDIAVYEALGALEMQLGNAPAARDVFAEALTLDATSAGARQGLTAALAALKK